MHGWAPFVFTSVLAGLTLADQPILRDFAAYQDLTQPYQTYRTSNITSPIFNYNTWRRDLMKSDSSSDHLFLTLDYNGAGPYLFRDDDLSLVYANPNFDYAMNARVQILGGQQWLTFWHGARNRGDSQGYCVFYNENYSPFYTVTIHPPLTVDADMHECEVTFDDHVLLTAYQDKVFDLFSIGGKTDDVLADSCFQEVEARGDKVYFTWCASDWFAPDLTYWNYTSKFDVKRSDDQDGTGVYTTSTGVDVYHINSVQKTLEGNYLVSLRNLKSLVYIDGQTGRPVWNLNGKMNNFTDVTSPSTLTANEDSGGALGFGWQHHARLWDEAVTRITMFDNHELSTELDCTGVSCSRGREMRVNTADPDHLTVELVRDYRSPHGLQSVIFGSMHLLPYSHSPTVSPPERVLVSWGVNAEFTEHTSNGRLVRDVQYSSLYRGHSVGGSGVQSSRVYKQAWHGDPLWPPSVIADKSGTLWVSWNGATEVREWQVYGGDTAADLGDTRGLPTEHDGVSVGLYPQEPLFGVAKAGFETKIEMGGFDPAFVKVAAVDVNGKVLGYSETLWMGSEISFRYKDTLSYISLSTHLV